jgi:serine/threonine-protein kinase HipA
MPSERDHLWVWIHLPGQDTPVLCGRAALRRPHLDSARVGEFVYGKSYLSREDAVAIDPIMLPLQEKLFTTTALQGQFGAILDAAPDQWGRRIIDREHGAQDDFEYLLLAKGDQVGALSFSAERDIPPSTTSLLDSSSLSHVHRAFQSLEAGEDIPAALMELLRHGTSAGGARPKITLVDEGKMWLAKLPSKKDSDDFPPIPLLEAAVLDLAEIAGLDVPPRKVVQFGGVPALMVARFDRKIVEDERGSRVQKMRFVSARTIFYSNPELQRYNPMGSYHRLAGELGRWSTQANRDRRELFERIVFNALVSNTDDHDLNHGLLAGKDFKLSPLFDVVPQQRTRGRLRLALWPDPQGATRQALSADAHYFGLARHEAETTIERLVQCVQNRWEACLAARDVSATHCLAVAPYFVPKAFDRRDRVPAG